MLCGFVAHHGAGAHRGIWFAVQAVQGVLAYGDPNVGVAFFAHAGGFVADVGLAHALYDHAPSAPRCPPRRQ